MSFIWSALFLLGTISACLMYGGDTALNAALSGAQKSVSLSISLAGSYIFFLGILGVAQKAGLIEALSKRMKRLIRFLMPQAGEAVGPITLNFAANMLGMGNAATPFGLEAMKIMQKNNKDKSRATSSMCTFIAINASSLQIIPTAMISLRAAQGALSPSSVTVASIISSAAATAVAVILCRVWAKKDE